MSTPSEPRAGAGRRKTSRLTIALALIIVAACLGSLLIFAFGFGHQG
jgi:hypothetical protein